MNSPEDHRRQASSFGAVAALYDSIRPTYPAAAVEWALEPLGPGSWRVADVGAGTGIMTRLVAAAGHEVVPVEPDPLMRSQLAHGMPGALVLDGQAESIPLPDGAVDAAVAAQAYHWFDPAPTHAELARVIRPGGVFAAIWNDRDEATDWVAAYTRVVDGDRRSDSSPAIPSFGGLFSPVRVKRFRHRVTITPDGLVALLRSRSYYLTATPERQTVLEDGVRGLLRDHPDLVGRPRFDLPYVTTVHRATRRCPSSPQPRQDPGDHDVSGDISPGS